MMTVMSRRRYRWVLECTSKGLGSSRSDFLSYLLGIRPMFYSPEEMAKFPMTNVGHTHDLIEHHPELHDDYHNGEFHVHIFGVTINEGKQTTIALQSATLAYSVVITFLFCF